jgi:hypothetical protein
VTRIDSWSDAYLVGNYALAAAGSGRSAHIENARSLLEQLVVEALTKMEARHVVRDTQEMAGRGSQYLLAHKDRYGVWYSTQATQNVIEAMIASMPVAAGGASAKQATIKVNGHTFKRCLCRILKKRRVPSRWRWRTRLKKGKTRLKS